MYTPIHLLAHLYTLNLLVVYTHTFDLQLVYTYCVEYTPGSLKKNITSRAKSVFISIIIFSLIPKITKAQIKREFHEYSHNLQQIQDIRE